MRVKRSPFKPRAKTGYRIENKTAKESTVYVYDEIGWFGIMAETFVKELNAINAETIHIRINSPGGDVFDGTAIANAIRQHKSKTITHIDGIAASISSVIALASDEIHMAENAFFMFHEAWSIAIGNASNMRDEADLLDKIDGVLAKEYAKKTGKKVDEIKDLMSAETWLTAEEAIEMGMVDSIEEDKEDKKAKLDMFDLSVFANVPNQLLENKKDINERDIEKALRDAGCSRSQAKEILAKGFIVSDQSVRDAQDDLDNQQTVRDAQEVIVNDSESTLRDAEKPKKKDRTADLLTRAEMIAPD